MEVPEDGVKSRSLTEDELNANLDDYEGKENPWIPLPQVDEYMALPPAEFVTAEEHRSAAAKAKADRAVRQRMKRLRDAEKK